MTDRDPQERLIGIVGIRPRIGVRCGCEGWYYPACREGPLSDGRPFFAIHAPHRGNIASYANWRMVIGYFGCTERTPSSRANAPLPQAPSGGHAVREGCRLPLNLRAP